MCNKIAMTGRGLDTETGTISRWVRTGENAQQNNRAQFTLSVPASMALRPPMYSDSIAAEARLASLATVLAFSSLWDVQREGRM